MIVEERDRIILLAARIETFEFPRSVPYVRDWAWFKTSAFRGQNRADSRPGGKARGKTRRKSSKKCWKMAPNGDFSRVSSAISPCPEPTALDRNPPACQTLRLWSPAASSRLRPRELAVEHHFSRKWARSDRHLRAMTAGRTVGFTHPALAHSASRGISLCVGPTPVLSPGPRLAGSPRGAWKW